MNRRTKIIATIGPATLDFDIFSKLIDEGVDIIRINTSFGNYDQYDQMLANLKKIQNKNVQVLYDIKKEESLSYFLEHQLDILAVSFAETKEQIEKYRESASKAFIVSKIESQQGIKSIEDLLGISDGIMVARGDLSEAEPIEKIPAFEKYLVEKTKIEKKFIIIATEMMLSMIDSPRPEIAEISDVGNAVFEGVSAVMLSEETAIGKYPIEAVTYMRKTIEESEKWLYREMP